MPGLQINNLMEKILPQTSGVDHKIYKRVENPKDADACAWVFKNAKEFVPYYFRLPVVAPHELRVRVLYTGLCHSDVSGGRNQWAPCNYPICAGHEVVGEVQIVGDKVENFKVGDKVFVGPIRNSCFKCEHCRRGDDNLCTELQDEDKYLYGRYFGGWATHIQQPAHHIFHIPEGMDLRTCAPIICAGVTVFAPMQRHLKEKGLKVGIIGIGGLGHLALQYGRSMGFEMVAFTTSEDKRNECFKLGASHVVVVDKELKELEKWQDKVDFLINNLYVIDMKTLDTYLKCIKNGGKLIQIGLPPHKQPMEFNFNTIVLKQIGVVGTSVASIQESKDTLEFTNKNGTIVQTEDFSFVDFPKALNRIENERPHFRCVVNVKDFVDAHFP